jgi:hemoglobin
LKKENIMKKRLSYSAFALSLLVCTPTFAQNSAPTAPVITTDDRLFADFGGREGLVQLMDDFWVNLLADPRTRPFFEASDQVKVKGHLVEQFCVILNGGCTYTGRDMKTTHDGMGVNQASFYGLVEALQKSMAKRNIPFRAQNKLLAALAPQHRDIVAPTTPPPAAR